MTSGNIVGHLQQSRGVWNKCCSATVTLLHHIHWSSLLPAWFNLEHCYHGGLQVSTTLCPEVLAMCYMMCIRRIRKRDASKYHVQLCVAIFCMMLVFVTGIEQTDDYGGCVSVSVLIHYFTLAAIFWMAAEALLMFRKLVFVFERTTNNFIIVVSIACWGKYAVAHVFSPPHHLPHAAVPLVPVLVPFIIDLTLGNDPSNDLIIRRPGL